TVKTTPGETTRDVEIVLEDGGSIEGRVLNPEDKPVPAVLYVDGSGSPAAFPDGEGNFKLEDLRSGSHKIRAMHRHTGELKEVTAETGAKNIKIVLGEKEKATIHGRVVEANSRKPITDFDIVGAGRIEREGEG